MNNNNFITNDTNNSRERFFKQVSNTDRMVIETLINRSLNAGYKGPKITVTYLAKRLGYNKSTISREIKRGQLKELNGKGQYVLRYRADYAKDKRSKSSKRSHYRTKLNKGCPELKYIDKMIRSGADVNTAMVIYKNTTGEKFPVCEKTLYNYFHKNMLKGIHPYKKVKTPEITIKQGSIGKNIIERPKEVESRDVFGHWEGDLIVGSRGASKECLLTLIERSSRFYYAVKIKDKTSASVVDAINGIESLLGADNFKQIFKTITFDNGREFANEAGIEKSHLTNEKRCDVYYANPYHSWERGSNERGNRMMRKYYPKRTDFSKISNESIHKSICKINYTARKILNNLTSMDIIEKLESSISTIFKLFNMKNLFIGN